MGTPMTVANIPGNDFGRAAARDLAHNWANRGIPVFPAEITWDATKYGGAGGTDKRPLTPNGHKNATTDHQEIDRLFDAATPRPGGIIVCALLPGPAGYIALDLDRKGGKNGIAIAETLQLRDTWGATTPSGGEHRLYRLPDNCHVTNSSPWADDGIDIRANDGWIIAPGTHTPWGSWIKADTAYEWPTDVAPIPQHVLDRLRTRPTTGTSSSAGVNVTGWTRLTETQRAELHPATLAALQHLEQLGGHDPIHKTATGREPWIEITRPGKRYGTSATIGYIAPGVIKSWTPNWPGLPEGRHETTEHGLVHADTLTIDHWDTDPPLNVDPTTGEITYTQHDDPDVHQLLARQDDPYDWLIEGLIERGDRLILTGLEGKGKSTLLRQIAICASAGLHPFTHDTIPPLRVLYIDLENSERQIRRKIRPLYHHVARNIPDNQLIFHIRPEGLDLTQPADRTHTDAVIRSHTPDIVIIGPIYKLHSGDPIEEKPAKQVATYIDYLRTEHGCAFLIEAHTPYAGSSGSKRPERPYGASLWSRWPEFGIFLSETGQLTHWRGQRDEREWPTQLRRADTNTWPWEVEENPRQVTFARMVEVARALGYIPSNRDIAKTIGCSPTTVGNAIKANLMQWELLREEIEGE